MQTTINFGHTESILLYFVPVPPEEAAVAFVEEGQGQTLQLLLNYDYEIEGSQQWKFYVDVTLTVDGIAKIATRSCYNVEAPETILFTKGLLITPLEASVSICLKSLGEQYAAHNIKGIPLEVEVFKSNIEYFSEVFCDQYFSVRKESDAKNRHCQVLGMQLERGKLTELAVYCTIRIIDEIMFCHPAFNHQHNQDQLWDAIPPSKYVTFKLKSLGIQSHDVDFTVQDLIIFMILMDAALQILLGEHSYKLKETFEKANLTEDKLNEYIKYAASMIRAVKAKSESGARLYNLDKTYDWNALIA